MLNKRLCREHSESIIASASTQILKHETLCCIGLRDIEVLILKTPFNDLMEARKVCTPTLREKFSKINIILEQKLPAETFGT